MNLNTPNDLASKYIKCNLRELHRDSRIMVRESNILLSDTERSNRQMKIKVSKICTTT